MIGRPVYFVDRDAARDAKAEQTLRHAAQVVGFREIAFAFEPIAAAIDFERTLNDEMSVLVADIGGGTSDFSIVRVGPHLGLGSAARAPQKAIARSQRTLL